MEILNKTALKFAFLANRKNFPGHSMTVIVKGTFRLIPGGIAELIEEQEFPTGDKPYPDDDEGQSAPRFETDFAPFKPRADLLLVGSCYVPGGGSATVSRATFGIGSYRKMVGVIGDRRWQGLLGGKTDPAPFRSMPIRYENAFGGPDSKRNPVGKGHGKREVDGKKTQDLPNIEDPTQLIKSNRDRPDPVGFGPVDRRWEDRFKKTGTYKGDWKKTRFPAFPTDFDWSYFNCAPKDQQVPFLKGDEEIYAENLHPERSEYTSRLPGLRVRVIVRNHADGGNGSGPVREVPMNLDTVWVDMDQEEVVLVWRGLTEVRSEEFEDVSDIVVVSERLEDNMLPAKDYADQIPQWLREIYDPEEEHEESASSEHSDDTASVNPSPPADTTPLDDEELPEEIVGPTVETRQELEALLAEGEPLIGSDLRHLNLSGLRAPEADLRFAKLDGVDLTDADLTGVLLDGASLSRARLNRVVLKQASAVQAILDQADLTEADLCEADFTLCSMKSALLTRARAEDAVFDHCNMEEANLDEVEGPSASFDSANLTRASFERGSFSAAYFENAMLSGANCRAAAFPNSHWAGVTGLDVVLDDTNLQGLRTNEDTNLQGSSFVRARGGDSTWSSARMDRCDFSFADMPGASFNKASLVGATFHCANMPEAKFRGADCTSARFTTMNLFLGSMEKANLTRTILNGSNMYGVEFLDAVFHETVGEGTNLKMSSQDPRRR